MINKATFDLNDFCYYLIAFNYNSIKEYNLYDEMYSTIYDTPLGFIERFKDTYKQHTLTKKITVEQCVTLLENQLSNYFIKVNKFYVSTYAIQKLKLTEKDIINDALNDGILNNYEVKEL